MSDNGQNLNDEEFSGLNVEIALVNHEPKYGKKFDWASFDPHKVQSPLDLPEYLCLGFQNTNAFVKSEDGWGSVWQNDQQGAKLLLNFNKKTGKYSATQSWQGIEGSSIQCDQTESLPGAISQLYAEGFPASWSEKAASYFSGKYQVSWIKTPNDMTQFFGLPDGIFFNISFPVMIKNIRYAREIFQDVVKREPVPYGFFVTATMIDQKISYKYGVAPDWTEDPAQVITQSLGETGLVPMSIPEEKDEKNGRYMQFDRSVVMLNVSLPFIYLDDMLDRLSDTPMPVYKTNETLHRRDTLPIILPTSIFEMRQNVLLEDVGQGITVEFRFFPVEPLDQMLQRNADEEIDTLEKVSDQIIDQLISESKGFLSKS